MKRTTKAVQPAKVEVLAPRKPGRPSTYSEDIALRICTEIAQGRSLRSICEQADMPSLTAVLNWLGKHASFERQYAHAREQQADALADEILDIAEEPVASSEEAQRQRLRVDARKWIAAKLKPRKYGDHQEIDLNVSRVDDELASARKRLAAVSTPDVSA